MTETCSALRDAVREAGAAADVQELMGVEGAASARYFACVSALLPEEMRFTARSRRPPLDLPNAALSYAYAILLGECVGALLAAGLEPSLGVLHSSTDKRPSLALDLMEEFRPLLVDRTVVALLRTGRLRVEHAVPSPDGEGVWLSRDGRRRWWTVTRLLCNVRSRGRCRVSPGRGGVTCTTRPSCWGGRLWNLVMSGWGRRGGDRDSGL